MFLDDIKVVFEEELSEHLLDYVEQYHTCVPNQFKDYDLNVKTHNLSTFLPNVRFCFNKALLRKLEPVI